MPIEQFDLRPVPETMQVLFDHASHVLKPGYGVGFDHNRDTTSGDMFYIEQPSTANLVLYSAGIVSDFVVGDGTIKTVSIVPWWWQGHNIDVFTDANVTAGDQLGLVDGSYFWRTYVSGRMRFVATQTVDRSGTNGLVRGILINQA